MLISGTSMMLADYAIAHLREMLEAKRKEGDA
jgi:hypothetical protein